MSRHFAVALIADLTLCLVACSGSHDSASTPTPSPSATMPTSTATSAPSPTASARAATSTPPPTATLPPSTPDPGAPQLPLDTKTGIAPVDLFLILLDKRDFAAIATEAVFPLQPCTEQQTGIPAQPPCASGQSEGDPTPAQIFATCEHNYLPPESRSSLAERLNTSFSIASTAGFGRPYLESVWNTIAFGATYAVVIVFPSQGPGTAVSEIVYLDAGGHFAGQTACGDYDVPLGNALRIYPP